MHKQTKPKSIYTYREYCIQMKYKKSGIEMKGKACCFKLMDFPAELISLKKKSTQGKEKK